MQNNKHQKRGLASASAETRRRVARLGGLAAANHGSRGRRRSK